MNPLIVLMIMFVSSLYAHAGPAVGLKCDSTDGEFSVEAVINQHSGDIFEDSVKVIEKNQPTKAQLKQYKKYDDDLFMILSLGPSGPYDDTGYILDLEKSYNDDKNYSGYAQKYHANPPGTREEDTDAYLRVNCRFVIP